jgi:predicted AlkP superfamily phosphohydrolase/phosphomutase
MGIKQTGEFRDQESDLNQLVLNKYLLEEVYEADNVFVFSDHGAVYAKKRFYLNTWPRENGFLRQKEEE